MSVLIYFDQEGYNMKKSQLGIVAGYLQQAVTAYNTLGLSALNQADFIRLFNQPIDLIFDKMTGGNPVLIGGLPVDKSKAIEILAKPIGYDNLITTINNVIAQMKDAQNTYPSIIQYAFQLDVSGNVVILATYDLSLQEQYKRYATSDTAIGLNTLALSIVDQINTFNLMDKAKNNPNGFGRFIADLYETRYGQVPTINWRTIIEFN